MQNSRYVSCDGKDFIVIDLTFDPVDQVLNVFWRWQSCWFLELVPVRPEILVPRSTRHLWTGSFCAILGDGSVDEIDAVEEVDNVHGGPVIHIFSFWELYHLSKVDA
jgi:hypothetical protein